MPEIKNHNGRPAVFIDGVPYPPMMATIRTIDRSEIIFDKEYFENLGRSGIKIYFLICDTVWLKPDALEVFDREARALLEAVPDAYIVPRIGLHPTNEWIETHPEECVKYSDGSSPPVFLFTESYQNDLPRFYSLCSEKWREDGGKALEETWKLIMALPYADRIVGCFLAAGGTSEWYYIPLNVNWDKGICLDHSEAFKREFSAYLREMYGSDENLQKHWKNPDATIENPPIPDIEKHYYCEMCDADAASPKQVMRSNADVPPPYGNGTNFGSFADLDKNPDVYDFYRAWHIGTAKSVLHFAKIIKRLTPDKLIGAFYGAQGCVNFLRSGTTGATRMILESDCVDFLANPGVYENRQPGGFTGQRVVQDTFALYNKIYIVEDDARTSGENRYFRDKYQIYDMTDTVNVLKREFGRNICDDVHAWWFDQILGGRRYRLPEVYELFSKQQQIAKDAYSLDRTKKSEIAFIFDEESMQAASFQTSRDLIEMLRNYEIAKIGAPADQYYHNDMSNPDMPSYKLYVFVNVLVATEAEREAIKAKLRRDGAVAVWLYAPGFIDPEADRKLSAEHMKKLTGMDIDLLCERHDAVFRWDGDRHAVSERLDTRKLYGSFVRGRSPSNYTQIPPPVVYYETYLYPLFFCTDKDAAHLAHFCNTGIPAVSVKECDGFTSVFYGSKSIKHDELRELARFAGCHIWCESDDVTYIGANYVTFHASSEGRKTLKIPYKASVYEVYEGKSYGENVAEFDFDAYTGETKMFRIIR